MIKKGNQKGTEAFLRSVALPEKTKTYTPITHGDIIDKLEAELSIANFVVEGTEYLYSHGGDIASGKVYIQSTKDPDMGMLFSWVNSYNKKVKFSCGVGAFVYENKTSFFGTEGLSWIRKHTGTANAEAFNIIEQIVDHAHFHFDKIIAEKNRMKAQAIDLVSYSRIMGALYFEHELLTITQSSAIDREFKSAKSEIKDKTNLWGLYKILMFGIDGVDLSKWQQSQQKLHHMIMAEYAIAVEDMTTSDIPTEIHQESDLEYQERVVDIENEMEEPLAPNELRETGPPTQEEMSQALDALNGYDHEVFVDDHERMFAPSEHDDDEEVLDDRQEWADKVLAEDNTEDDHVGPPEMYAGETVVLEANEDGEPLVSAKFQEFDFTDESVVEVDEDELVEDPIKLAGEITGISNDVEENEVGVELEEEEIIETISNEGFEEVVDDTQISKEDCCIEGSHMASVDDNGFCNNCGEKEPCEVKPNVIEQFINTAIKLGYSKESAEVYAKDLYDEDKAVSLNLKEFRTWSEEKKEEVEEVAEVIVEEPKIVLPEPKPAGPKVIINKVNMDEERKRFEAKDAEIRKAPKPIILNDSYSLEEVILTMAKEEGYSESLINFYISDHLDKEGTVADNLKSFKDWAPTPTRASGVVEVVTNLNEPVQIIEPKSEVIKEEHQDALDKASEEGSEKFILPEDKAIEIDPFDVGDEDFLEVGEHEGLEVSQDTLDEAKRIEGKMTILYGSVKPYSIERTPSQINVVIDETLECFFLTTI